MNSDSPEQHGQGAPKRPSELLSDEQSSQALANGKGFARPKILRKHRISDRSMGDDDFDIPDFSDESPAKRRKRESTGANRFRRLSQPRTSTTLAKSGVAHRYPKSTVRSTAKSKRAAASRASKKIEDKKNFEEDDIGIEDAEYRPPASKKRKTAAAKQEQKHDAATDFSEDPNASHNMGQDVPNVPHVRENPSVAPKSNGVVLPPDPKSITKDNCQQDDTREQGESSTEVELPGLFEAAVEDLGETSYFDGLVESSRVLQEHMRSTDQATVGRDDVPGNKDNDSITQDLSRSIPSQGQNTNFHVIKEKGRRTTKVNEGLENGLKTPQQGTPIDGYSSRKPNVIHFERAGPANNGILNKSRLKTVITIHDKLDPSRGKRKLPFDHPEPRKRLNGGPADRTVAVERAADRHGKAVGVQTARHSTIPADEIDDISR